MIGIYKITSPSGRIYIGQSKNTLERESNYRELQCKGQTRIYRSLLKHGWENHTFEIIEECEFEQLNIREHHWQDFYNIIGENGLNCMLTRTDTLPQQHSEETKKKISESQKGKKLPEHHVEKLTKYILIDVETKEIFRGCTEPAKRLGVHLDVLYNIFRGKRKNTTNLILLEDYDENKEYIIKSIDDIRIRNTNPKVKKLPRPKKLDNKGENNPNFGKKWTEEQKKKASEYLKSLNRTGKNSPNFGKPFTEERKANISKAHKGKKLSEKHTAQIKDRMIKNNPFKGKTHTEGMAEYLRLKRVKYTVINVETKEVFAGLTQASKSINVSSELLQQIFGGKRENTTNLVLLKDYDETKEYKIRTYAEIFLRQRPKK